LIVDDEKDLCALLRKIFSADYEVLVAHSGEGAIKNGKKRLDNKVITVIKKMITEILKSL